MTFKKIWNQAHRIYTKSGRSREDRRSDLMNYLQGMAGEGHLSKGDVETIFEDMTEAVDDFERRYGVKTYRYNVILTDESTGEERVIDEISFFNPISGDNFTEEDYREESKANGMECPDGKISFVAIEEG